MSHDHLESAVQNLIAFERHAETDGCPRCMTKHSLAFTQFLQEEAEQSNGAITELAKEAETIYKELPEAYGKDNLIMEDKMRELQRRARKVRNAVMSAMKVPDHKHRETEHITVG